MINFHTDSRSKKVSQLEEQADICALFYDKKKKSSAKSLWKNIL